MVKWIDDQTLEQEDVSLSLAQDQIIIFFLNWKLLYFYVFVATFNFQKNAIIALSLAFRIRGLARL